MSVKVMQATQPPMPVKFNWLFAENNQLTKTNDTTRLQHYIIDADDFTVSISDNEGGTIKVRNVRTFILPLKATCFLEFLSPPRSIVMMEL